MAQIIAKCGESIGSGTATRGWNGHDRRLLSNIVSSILATPTPLPPWCERDWRAALRYRDTGPRPSCATLARAEVRDAVLRDPAVGDLVRWAANRRPLSYQLGAIAASLAALGEGVAAGESNSELLAGRVVAAVDRARALQYCPVSDRAMLADCDAIADATPPASAGDRSSLVSAALGDLLAQAGCCVSVQSLLAQRIEAAVDVCLGAWLRDAEAGEGLPEFRRAEAANHRRRLSFLLGADRDLQRLVEGPVPGRGRPLHAARRRGLAYWVALTLRSAADGSPPLPVPAEVVGHWRDELRRAGATPAP